MMGKVIMSGIVPPLVAPVTGIQLGDIAEGSIVKLNESGSPVEFYVAKHDYESALNGTGRTLLVRKNGYDKRAWHSSNVNTYASSSIDTWLNGTYKALLDANVQEVIGNTKFYYTPGNGTNTVTSLQRSVFLMSITEMGKTSNTGANALVNTEGSKLPIATTLQVAYFNGSAVHQWSRSPNKAGNVDACYMGYSSSSGAYVAGNSGCTYSGPVSRPCFTLPSGACFDEETMLFNGKIA